MAVRIRITGIEALADIAKKVRQALGAGILDLDADLKISSPVDQGYFVNSWQPQANGQPAPREGFAGPRQGSSAVDAAVIFQGLGGTVALVNTAVYGPRLADGYSPQAPAGWVEAAANRLQDHVDKHVLLSRGT